MLLVSLRLAAMFSPIVPLLPNIQSLSLAPRTIMVTAGSVDSLISFRRIMRPADSRKTNFDRHKAKTLFPCEFQLRSGNLDYLYPQSLLQKYFHEREVPTIDLYDSFAEDMRVRKTKSTDYYLFGDPMHFSAFGHARVRAFLSERLRQLLKERPS